MKYLIAFIGLLVCISVASCSRHYNEEANTEESSDGTDHITKARDFAAGQMRHRRKRWQNNYGYDYAPPPPYPMPYYPDRREYDRNQQDLLPQILRLLDEISSYVKRPPPPPQPIYVPYPVPYPVPQLCSCATPSNGSNPFVGTRLRPTLDDSNQNWGIVESNDNSDYEDGGDGSRPISFDPIKPTHPTERPAPKVDHGSSQGDKDLRPEASSGPEPDSISKPANTCNVAVLSCCSGRQQRACFTKFGCAMTFAKGNACTPSSITAALDSFKTAYAPTY